MLKFLRKYNKLILVIGGSLLMVAFLLPTALTQGGGGGDPKVLRIDGETIRLRQYQATAARVQLFQNLQMVRGLIDANERPVDHWLLLVHAAREGGFMGGPSDGAEALSLYLPEDVRAAVVRTYGEEAVIDALAEWRGVYRMITTYTGAGRLSEVEARILAQELFDEAQVRAAAIKAEDILAEIPEPTEEELQAHFDTYRDMAPGQGEHGFGYRQPAAIQLSWIALETVPLSGAVTLDPIEVRKRWQANRSQYPGEFDQERGAVERDLRNEQVEILKREADQIIQSAALNDAKQFQERGRWLVLPEDWSSKVRRLEVISVQVGEAIQKRTGTLLPPPVLNRTRWMDVAELSRAPGIGRAQVAIGTRLTPFPLIIEETREIGGNDARGPQVGVLSRRPATDQLGNMYYYRITAARPEGPPESLDAVREDVVRNVKRLRAFEQLSAQVDVLRQRAINESVERIANTMQSEFAHGIVTERRLASLSPTLDQDSFREAVMETARTLDPTTKISEIPVERRIVVQPVPETLTVGVAEILGRRPVTSEQFRASAEFLAQRAAQEAILSITDWPYSLEHLLERYRFVDLGPGAAQEDEATDEGADESATEGEDAEPAQS